MAGQANAGVAALFDHEDTKDTKVHEGSREPATTVLCEDRGFAAFRAGSWFQVLRRGRTA